MKKNRIPELGRPVIVRWKDIATDTGWTDTHGVLRPAKCTSIGLVTAIAEDRSSITLAGMYGVDDGSEDHQANSRHSIPTGCIDTWAYLVEEPAKIKINVKVAK